MRLLLDNSAWVRLDHVALPDERVTALASAVDEGRVVTSAPFLLEAGFSARSAQHHRELLTELQALPYVVIDADVERRALEAQSELARVGHHRPPPIDLLIAALAAHHRLGVLHYDRVYDVLREKTALEFESVWLAPAGSL